jgi:hypothetical protein
MTLPTRKLTLELDCLEFDEGWEPVTEVQRKVAPVVVDSYLIEAARGCDRAGPASYSDVALLVDEAKRLRADGWDVSIRRAE